jgi:hypothetical protein
MLSLSTELSMIQEDGGRGEAIYSNRRQKARGERQGEARGKGERQGD